MSLIDLRYTFVPDEISLNLSWLTLGAFFIPMNEPLDHFFGLIAGYGVILMIRWLGYLMYRREAMGLGDAKLLAFIRFLGWQVIHGFYLRRLCKASSQQVWRLPTQS